MAYPSGARIGAYQIVGPLGAGGMGEVYRGRDARLNRDVAIKVLPARIADDADYIARFQREAQALAALNHPNIAAIYGLEHDAIVMELVEGKNLADRIAAGPLPLDEALTIARQVADALEAAHEKGIVHRDLKPANVMITPSGVAKVLDFGLAKSVDPAVNTSSHDSPTLTIRATDAGILVGTVAYMSPEQARGKTVDKRADIWAFGVLLYECITGQQLFRGETVSDTLAAVLRHDPDWNRVPAELRRLLQSCLEREPKRRLRDIGDVWRLLEPAPAPRTSRSQRSAWSVACLALVPAVVLAWIHFREATPAVPSPIRFQFTAPQGVRPGGVGALSPDGRRVAYLAQGPGGVRQVWLHDFGSLEDHLVPGSEKYYGSPLSWSADSRFLAAQSQSLLRRFDIAGGLWTTLGDVRVAVGNSWNQGGIIVFGSGGTGPIQQLSTRDGSIAAVTKLDFKRGFTGDLMPWFLPDGKHFLYLRRASSADKRGIYAGSLDRTPENQDTRQLVATTLGAIYVGSAERGAGAAHGFLLFQRERTLFAQRFDADRLAFAGEPVPIAEGVGYRLDTGFFGATPDVLVYRGGDATQYQLTWSDANGTPLGVAGEPGEYPIGVNGVALSPDGNRAAVTRVDRDLRSLWLVEFARGTMTRLTFDDPAQSPVWSPDGSEIVFRSNRRGKSGIYRKPADGSKDEELLLASDQPVNPTSWSPNRRFVLYDVRQQDAPSVDMWILSLDDHKTRRLIGTDYDEGQGVFSPDGRWIAYLSNESGREEVYVTGFQPDGSIRGKWTVSRGALSWSPHWRSDSGELEYVASDSSLMSVAISPGAQFGAGPPKAYGRVAARTYGAIAPDGKRVLSPLPVGKDEAFPFTAVIHWQSGLDRR